LAQSSKFPFIDFANFNHFWEKIESNRLEKPDQATLERASIELVFMRSTRTDNERGIGGSQGRGEFMEALVRLSRECSKDWRNFGDNFEEFVQHYLKPSYQEAYSALAKARQ